MTLSRLMLTFCYVFSLQKHSFAKVKTGESCCLESVKKCRPVKTVTGDVTDSFSP